LPRGKASTATSEAPGARLLDREPSAIHVADAEFINEFVGKQVVTPRQVMFNKILLARAQAARAAERDGVKPAKATKAKPAAKPAAKPGRKPAAGKAPAKATKATAAKPATRRTRGSQAAKSQETAATATEDTAAEAPF
jgi:hypothetical protein